MTIRAELIGDYHASAMGITVTGPSPVLRLCRELINAGHDPKTCLEVFRGDMLCLTVRTLREGASLVVKSTSGGEISLALASVAAPSISENDLPATQAHENENNARTGLLHGEAVA